MASRPEELADELVEARRAFFAAIDTRDPNQKMAGDWGALEVIAHLGYWAGHAADAIHAAEQGTEATFGPSTIEIEERDATVARVARQTDLRTVKRREAASVEALLERIRRLDQSLLERTLGDGVTLEFEIRGDGALHYRKHLDELPPA